MLLCTALGAVFKYCAGVHMQREKWKIWDTNQRYGNLLYRRAVGLEDEMESSKSLCKILTPLYKKGMKLLDVGCGAGHYLRSLQQRLDANIDYTGIDATRNYIDLAKKAFGNKAAFLQGDVFNMPYHAGAFDIVTCNNLILHLPPPPLKPLSELIRVASQYVIIRTVIGVRNYIIKAVESNEVGFDDIKQKPREVIGEDGEGISYCYFNLYTEDYFLDTLEQIDANLKVEILHDNSHGEFDNTDTTGIASATKTFYGKQVSGNILLDWRFIVIEGKG